EATEDDEDGVLAQAPELNAPAARDRDEEGAVGGAAGGEPALEGMEGAAGRVDEALAVALAEDADRAVGGEGSEGEGGGLGAGEAGAVEEREEGGVAGAARRRRVALGEEGAELARGERAAAGEALAADALDGDGEFEVLEVDQAEAARSAQHAAERGE